MMSGLTNLTSHELQHLLDSIPLASFMGIRLDSWDAEAEELTCSMPMRSELGNYKGSTTYHGGSITSLIDTVCCIALMGKGHETCPTTNIRVDFLRAARDSGLRCVATIRRTGRTASTVDADVMDDEGRLVAIGRCCLQIM